MRWLGLAVGAGLLTLAGCGSDASRDTRTEHEEREAVEGSRGPVRYAAGARGEAGAWARFELTTKGEKNKRAVQKGEAAAETETLEVRVVDQAHAELSFRGVTLDGDGALTARERATLEQLEATGLVEDLALIPLELGCEQGDLKPEVLAALLFPWQLLQKYLVVDRSAQTAKFAAAASCRYFTPSDGSEDLRPNAQYPLLANGQVVARSFGYLPLDVEGALTASSVQKQFDADQNVYGPGDSMCRGACGADCEENNCGEPKQAWRCVQENGRNTGYKELWLSYTCGEHPGCIEHDACFDDCKVAHGVDSWDAAFCMRGCDLQAAAGYGALQGIDWAQGYGPFSHERTYDYSQGDPIYDEASCPLDFALTVTPGSGVAPHATQLSWSFQKSPGGAERCRLDLGDGSPLVTFDPCPENGTYHHIYGVPSEMREASGLYQATLERIGSASSASADVQANWVFQATATHGTAPLATSFSWLGFALVDKPLTCSIDFGDGSAPEVLEDCKNKFVSHEYGQEGVYTATLRVTGEDRPVSKVLVIEVGDDPEEHRGFADVLTWELNYDILTDATHSWSEYGISYQRTQVETESATLVLHRRSFNDMEITLEGTGTASSSLQKTYDEQSQYHHNTRYDQGSGSTETHVYVTIDPQSGYYDVYINTGEFEIAYGGTDSTTYNGSHTYGPSTSTYRVAPAPILATGELTRKLPSESLNISDSYTWEAFHAYEQSQDSSYDREEAYKRTPKTGTTSFTLRPLTYAD